MTLAPGQIWFGIPPDNKAMQMVIEIREVDGPDVYYNVWVDSGRGTLNYRYERDVIESWVQTTATQATPAQRDCLVSMWNCKAYTYND